MRLLFGLLLSTIVGCATTGSKPELRVLGTNRDSREVVFVQVTNPASHAMKLTKLEYSFAADGATVSTGEVPLERDVPAGAAVVVEVPLSVDSSKPLMLEGKLTAESDQVVRTFPVEAQIAPH